MSAETGERFDRCVLDLPAPWEPLEAIAERPRAGGGAVRLPPDDGPDPTARACSSGARVPAHRDLRGASARLARHRAERPARSPHGRAHRVSSRSPAAPPDPIRVIPSGGPKPSGRACRRYVQDVKLTPPPRWRQRPRDRLRRCTGRCTDERRADRAVRRAGPRAPVPGEIPGGGGRPAPPPSVRLASPGRGPRGEARRDAQPARPRHGPEPEARRRPARGARAHREPRRRGREAQPAARDVRRVPPRERRRVDGHRHRRPQDARAAGARHRRRRRSCRARSSC